MVWNQTTELFKRLQILKFQGSFGENIEELEKEKTRCARRETLIPSIYLVPGTTDLIS